VNHYRMIGVFAGNRQEKHNVNALGDVTIKLSEWMADPELLGFAVKRLFPETVSAPVSFPWEG